MNFDPSQEFYEKLRGLSRDELLEIITMQNPDYIDQIKRIEFVFKRNLKHLRWDDGEPIKGREFTDEELIKLIDPPFMYSREYAKMGFNEEMQRQIHVSADPVIWGKTFLNLEPRVYQVLVLRDPGNRIVLRWGRRLGKALHIDTEIPTPNGWKTMKELEIGDQVFDENGKPCNVTFATDVQWDRTCYKVHFSDGNSLIADADHQWTVDTKASRKSKMRAKYNPIKPITITTKEMIDNLYVEIGNKLEVNYSIEISKPVEYEAKDLPIDPWLFGLWLADGTSCRGDITIGYEDQKETLDRISELGYKYHEVNGTGITFHIEGLWSQLNKLKVLKRYAYAGREGNGIEKFIPNIYLQGSIDQRDALLKGLMDGDGTVSNQSNGNCEFSVCRKELADGVYELIQSLGYRATFKESEAKLYGRVTGMRYRLNFTPWRPVFALERKLNRQILRDEPAPRQKYRYITAIEKIDSVPVKCISVDSPSSLYLAGRSYIPTHNTFTMALLALWYAYTHPGAKVLVISPMKAQVGLIYQEIMKMTENNDVVSSSVERHVTSPNHEINLYNKSDIRFFTTGMKSGGKANVTRGQEADLIVLDEMDYMGQEDLIALLAIMQTTDKKKKTKKTMIAASTPSGLRNTFWRWNTDPDYGFHSYWFPSYANPGWDIETEHQMRLDYNETDYRHEIEADWGEPAEGVYPRYAIDRAFVNPGWTYEILPEAYRFDSHFVMGVDWDKYAAGVNIVVLEICSKSHPIEEYRNKVRLAYREEVKKGDFTYTIAVERIKYLNQLFKFKHIYVDRGYGEVQLEQLVTAGIEDPSTGLHLKVKGIQFSENIEVRDPYTQQPVKKRIKAFMIDNLYRMLEEERILFSEDDSEVYFQLISYVVVKKTAYGDPIFGPGAGAVDHAHDALLLAGLAVAENYDELLKAKFTRKSVAVSSEAFLNLFAAEGDGDEKLVKDKWGDKSTEAPVVIRRSLTAGLSGRANRRPNGIKRKMF